MIDETDDEEVVDDGVVFAEPLCELPPVDDADNDGNWLVGYGGKYGFVPLLFGLAIEVELNEDW